jgi:hypothetical protein
MTTGAENPNELVYKALCRRHRATTKGAANPMTRQELQEATGLTAEALIHALRALVGPNADQDLSIRFVGGDPDKITLGLAWVGRCEDKGLGA